MSKHDREAIREKARQYRMESAAQAVAAKMEGDPAKQFVRRIGWMNIIKDYIAQMRAEGVNRAWRYLTFPGPNATDIGYLWREGLLQKEGDTWPHVYICDQTSADYVISNIGTFGGVSSRTFHEAVHGPDNGDLCRFFPFDVINLDISKPLVTGNQRWPQSQKTIEAIKWIFQLQRGQSFLLLLTSLPTPDASTVLSEIILENLSNLPEFNDKYQERYGNEDLASCLADYTEFTLLAIPKILARVARNLGYSMKEHFVARYDRPKGDNEYYEYCCHSFEFVPLGKVGSGKYGTRFRRIPQDEVSEELPAPTQIKAIEAYTEFVPTLLARQATDIDEVLSSDTILRDELLTESASLNQWWRDLK